MPKPFGIFLIELISGGRDISLPEEKDKNRPSIPQQQSSSSNQFQTTWDD